MTPKSIAHIGHLALGCALFCSNSIASTAAEPAAPAVSVFASPLSGARLAGSARMRFWGLDIYQARLWVRPGFQPTDFARHTFALELDYQRSFSRTDIATRSIEEMRRVGRFSETQASDWLDALRAALPDVKKGDRITGVHLPGTGMRFLLNGQLYAEVRDTELAPLFFGIWLSPATSEPALRQSLLAQVQP